ncbi:MAG: hypothetical protein ACLVAW_28490 [Eisenbergiella massiliensis]
MKKGQSHPASALSQKLLADGLLSLLEQKPFREITIKELCAHSDCKTHLLPALQLCGGCNGICGFPYH